MKNREHTESRILEAVASIIESEGFEKLGINTIASKANVSKMLIYRYFGGLEELIAQFIMQKDYWAKYRYCYYQSSICRRQYKEYVP